MNARLSILLLCLVGWGNGILHAEPPPARSLPLKEVERLVIENNRSLLGARRATAVGEAGIEMAGARPNPVVSLNTSGINGRRPNAGSGSIDTTLRIDQPIERGNKRDLRLSVAEALLQANRSDESDSLRQQTLLAR
ncbi:MAG: TolC family protein, partial [Dechloromonas sp.]|nr:TolC family protein [Dechloromonas sp.]